MLDRNVDWAQAIFAEECCLTSRLFSLSCPNSHKLRPEIEEVVADHQFPSIFGNFNPPYIPPKRPTQSAGPPPKVRQRPLFSMQILISFRHRLLVDLGSFWGGILGSFSALLAARLGFRVRFCAKRCFLKKRAPCGPQHDFGGPSAPRSAQDGSKRLLKSNFFALENRLKIGLVLGCDFDGFWLPNPTQKTWGTPPPFAS